MRVTPNMWAYRREGEKEPTLRIEYEGAFINVRYSDCRRLVDFVHDAADRREAEQRRRANDIAQALIEQKGHTP